MRKLCALGNMVIDIDDILNKLSEKIRKNRPAVNPPVVFVSDDNQTEETEYSPKWPDNTKKTVLIILIVISLVCLYFLRNLITPLIVSALFVFYLKPVVLAIKKNWKVSHKWAVVIVYSLLLILTLAVMTLIVSYVYGQFVNLFDLLGNSAGNLTDVILGHLYNKAGSNAAVLRNYVENSEFSVQMQNVIQKIGDGVMSFVQGVTSKIGWFFFVYGFSFFILWEMKDEKKENNLIKISGYGYDIEMGRYHLSLIWQHFLWGQMMLLLISLVVYSFLYILLGVRYAIGLSVVVGLTRMIPYIGSFFAWGAVFLVALFQETTLFGMNNLSYAILVIIISFLIDKFMDGFVPPKFLAETLKVHPASVLAAALICGRAMGFLGIFLAAPLVATLKLILRYVLCKLEDKDPWTNIETVSKPLSLKEYFSQYKHKFVKIYDKLKYHKKTFKARCIEIKGGKRHGSNGIKD